MNVLQFSLTPYSFNALALFFIGLAGFLSLLRLKEKSTATYLIIVVMISLMLGMLSWFANGIVFWGGAFVPFTDACAVISMSGVIVFAYHYPQKVNSLESLLAQIFAAVISIAALIPSLLYAFQYLIYRIAPAWLSQSGIGLLNLVASLVTLATCLRRMLVIQTGNGDLGWRTTFFAIRRAQSRPARLLGNFSLAIFFGMFQGLAPYLVSIPGLSGFPILLIINLSFSMMFIIVVYSIFDLTIEQPRLVVRLVGLSLVSVLCMSGIVGMYAQFMAAEWISARNHLDVQLAKGVIENGQMDELPDSVVYIISIPISESRDSNLSVENFIYIRSGTDIQFLSNESQSDSVIPSWSYYLDLSKLCVENQLSSMSIHYGNHPVGSYYQYLGCQVSQAGKTYEIGFSLAEMAGMIVKKCDWVWVLFLFSGLLILAVFPSYYRTNLIHPLDRLLEGVRQVDHGNLDIQIPVIYQDEVGFLTVAFNKMAVSLMKELAQRKKAEDELRQLNSSLAQRVADRTHELEALYDVSVAANQARDSSSLLLSLLERSLSALSSPMGMILLTDDPLAPENLYLAASSGLPDDWLAYYNDPPVNDPLLADVLKQFDPILVPDLVHEPRAPEFIRLGDPKTLILASLHVDGQMYGLMGVVRDANQSLDYNEIALLISLVGQVGSAVHMDNLRQRAQHASLLEERHHLARDLHDSVTQSLYGLSTLTEACKLYLERGDLQSGLHLLNRIGRTTRQTIREMRLFLHQLRPPVLEQEGLVAALELRLAAVEGRSDVHASLEADESIQLPLRVETALYHIAQEALNNALKHAGADTVTVRLARSGIYVLLSIIDDGCGFDLDSIVSGGMGLENMRTRAAEIGAVLDIRSRMGEGTCVNISVEERV